MAAALEQFADLTAAQRVERYYTAVTAETCRRSLRKFVKAVWPLIDPAPFVDAWHIDAMCLPGDSLITTDHGPRRIDEIVESDWYGRVLSYSHSRQRLEWKEIVRKLRSPKSELLDIHIDGKILTVTGNHPVYVVGKGYVRAEQVAIRDEVVQVRALQNVIHGTFSPWPNAEILQPSVLRFLESETREIHLSKMRPAQSVGSEGLYVVSRKSAIAQQTGSLPPMRKACLQITGAVKRQFSAIRHFLQSSVPCLVYAREKQSCLHPWQKNPSLFASVPPNAPKGFGARWASMLSVFRWRKDGCSSHRLESPQQRSFKPRDALSTVPQSAARQQHGSGHFETFTGTVSRIERSLRTSDCLYNLEVADNHNYFAQEVLVHNCDHLAYVALGDIRNLMINVPPRSSKSSICTVAFPAWVWCDHPEEQFLCASYASELAKLDAAKMRRIVESEWYAVRYPDVTILSDENRVDRFSNTEGGYRTTISVGSRTTGLGGNYQLLDDPHNTAEVEHEAARKAVIAWHDGAWRSRVNNPNTARRIYVGQRSHSLDLFAHVLEREEKRWVVLSLPMEYDGSRKCVTYINRGKGPEGDPIFEDPRKKPGSLLCPDRYDEDTVAREKEAVSERVWEAQYQQNPQGAGGKIWKLAWWRKWEWPKWHPEYRKSERPLPEFIEIIQSYDTAFEQGEEDSYSVRTTWGLFLHQDMQQMDKGRIGYSSERTNAIVLERKKWRPTFGELRDEAVESYNYWRDAGVEPDRVLVEKKASGHDLVKELRLKKLPVRAVRVQGDLVYRAHMASLPLQKGAIWYVDRPWARAFVNTCAQFPDVDFDDEISSAAIALMYMRKHMDLQLEDDDDNEDDLALFDPKIARNGSFYG